VRRIPFAGLLLLLIGGCTGASAQVSKGTGEQGVYINHLIQHVVGKETYSVTGPPGAAMMAVNSTISDRGTTRTTSATLGIEVGFAPTRLELRRENAAAGEAWLTELGPHTATMQEGALRRSIVRPAIAYVGFTQTPASVQMMLMRYWERHGKPASLSILRADAEAPPIEIRRVGEDTLTIEGRQIRVTRYTVANLVFGQEVLWMDGQDRLAALMTFAAGLPQEQVLDSYEAAFDTLFASGVAQEMANLDNLGRQVRPEAEGAFAIVGARLIDGTGTPEIPDSAVIVRDGKIAAVGARAAIRIPTGMRVIHAEGQSLLPGLWEMHSHYSGVEFGPALLAAGVTTARDCGGEFEFLTAVRDRIAHGALGPRLLAAGLIDSGGALAFGTVDAETPAQGIAAVDHYSDAGFEQIKIYTQLKPEVIRAISAEAHRRGMTVTGHVPAAVDTVEGIVDGMDQINHLQYVARVLVVDGKANLVSDEAKRLLALLKSRQIVVDPTLGWGEMASHPSAISTASFEPGVSAAPFALASRFETMGSSTEIAKFHNRMAVNGQIVKALFDAGIPLVAGSDTGLIGYGLDRELELYVQAGLSPMAAIQTATLGAARAMKLDRDSGSVEVGKRADLVLVNGDPTANISDVRRVTKVVTNGRLYDSALLGRSVGFSRTATPIRAVQ
jgi:imidazolonepropionase-like amidohydrolase